ncbi:hypothetical protein KKC44_00580 [Patescibacteria group bacterium]|nr:hypothetical protein [Patescibacteria group bacterium]MBU2259081.1 hypothetical protein [Patescibacteria group bacterium]
MDKIAKILKALSPKEREAMLLLMQQLKQGYKKIPGVKPLKGKNGYFRIRMGQYRIIFTVHTKSKQTEIRRITRRNEQTYKNI